MGIHGFVSLTSYSAADASRWFADRKNWLWFIVLAFVLINPVGYVGGGADDERYLNACISCLPVNHWEGRWPVTVPLHLSIGAFGLTRLSVALPFLLASLACLWLIKLLGDRFLNAGTEAALIFGLTPVFAIQAFSATVEPIEALFVLSAIVFLPTRPLLAGLCLGMAFQVRETSLAALIPIIVWQWRNRLALVWLGVGFLAPLVIELMTYWLATGDPLYRRHLSLRHTAIWSTELSEGTNSSLPIFNSALLQSWRYEPGIKIHWLIDGITNLIFNPKTGMLFFLAPVLLAVYRKRLPKPAVSIFAAAVTHVATLIYVLAIDPKPRMMYVPMAGLALVIGAVLSRVWNVVLASGCVTVVALSALCIAAQPRLSYWQKIAENWAQTYPIKVDYRLLFLFSDLKSNPAHKPYELLSLDGDCPSGTLREAPNHTFARLFGDRWRLCLIRSSALESNEKRPRESNLTSKRPSGDRR